VSRGVPLRRLVAFYGLALAWSWAAWLPLAAHALGWTSARPSPYWHLVGGLGPALAAIAVTARGGAAPVGRLVARVVRGPIAWVAVAVAAAAPLVVFLVAALALALAGAEVELAALGTSAEYPALGRIGVVATSLIFVRVSASRARAPLVCQWCGR
jgi:hypothetical protein